LESGDVGGGFLDPFDGDGVFAGEFEVAFAAEFVEGVTDELAFEIVLAAAESELDEESFLERTGGDAGGVEVLDDAEDPVGGFDGNPGSGGNFLEGDGEVAGIVEIADDGFADADLLLGEVEEDQLADEVVGERFLSDLGIEEELAPFLGIGTGAGSGGLLGEVVAPVLLLAAEFLDLAVPFILLVVLGRFFRFFEDGVGFELLLDEGAEFHDGSLEQVQGLLHLRREGLGERLILL
jgi:hypothetical protein